MKQQNTINELTKCLSACAAMQPETRDKLVDWIKTTIAPASGICRTSSYGMKHDAEEAIKEYVRNDEFKGAMLLCGFAPTARSVTEVNWLFRVKPNIPPSHRLPHGQRGSGFKTFGTVLREARKAENLSLRELADRVGVTAGYLSRVETDDFNPPAEDKLTAVAEELNIDPDVLLAQAGRVASDVMETIKQRPLEMTKLIRAAGKVMDESGAGDSGKGDSARGLAPVGHEGL